MANVNNPHGLVSLMRTMSGGIPLIQSKTKASGVSTAIFRNDAVAPVNDGTIDPGGTPGTSKWLGVALNAGAASTETTHLVVISPNAIFEAQCDDSIVAADVHLNCNLILGSGSSTTGLSGHQLDGSTKATTNTLDMKILGRYEVPVDVNDWGQYGMIVVTWNAHLWLHQQAGV